MSATALKSIKRRFSSLNHQNFEFFCLVPRSPTHTGLICGKTLELNISSLGPFKLRISPRLFEKTRKGPVLHCCVRNFFIEPPPDTQRKERRGERGIWVAMSCYLLHVTPPLPPPTSPLPTPRICRTACGHVIRISWRETLPPPTYSPLQDFGHFWRPRPKSRTASL
jgi:hypothetical protein